MSTIPFSELLASVHALSQASLPNQLDDENKHQLFTATISEDWLQGRTAFGGILASLALQALLKATDKPRPLRALMTAFIGPVSAGSFHIRTQHLRSGRSASWWQAEVIQDEAVKTTFTACFGEDRPSGIVVDTAPRVAATGPDTLPSLPFVPDLVPNFTQHFEMRWALGQPPMSAGKGTEMGAWIRFRQTEPLTIAHVVTFMDLLPPAVMQQLDSFKPVSSLTWHLSLLEDTAHLEKIDPQAWWFFHVNAQSAKHSYSQQEAILYDPEGKALAISQQNIAVFDQPR